MQGRATKGGHMEVIEKQMSKEIALRRKALKAKMNVALPMTKKFTKFVLVS